MRFSGSGHGEVWIFPIPDDAVSLEALALDVDPFFGEVAAFFAELDGWDIFFFVSCGAEFFFDHPLDGESVAVPAWDIVGVFSEGLLGTVDDIFEDFIEGGADVEVSVGVWGSVVEDEFFFSAGLFALEFEELDIVPEFEDFGFILRELSAHREGGFGQEDGLAPFIALFCLFCLFCVSGHYLVVDLTVGLAVRFALKFTVGFAGWGGLGIREGGTVSAANFLILQNF